MYHSPLFPFLNLLYHTGRRRIGGAAKREEVVPTDSQFLQAQGLLTSFAIRHRRPWTQYITQVGGRIGGAAKREEVVPTDSQFLQAQGLLTWFVLKYRGPGHSIP